MKIICFGDLHAHPFKDFSAVDDATGNTRLTAIIHCLDFIRNYALEHDIDLVLDAGDIFHKRNNIDTTTYNSIFQAIKAMSDDGIQVAMIPGNHTQVDNSDMPETSIEPFSEIERVQVLKAFEPYIMLGPGVNVYPAPYSKNADMVKAHIDGYVRDITEEAETDRAEGRTPPTSILLGHMGVSGASVGSGNFTMADAFSVADLHPDVFDFVVLGHFHKRQTLGGYDTAFYTGSPIQHNFNDEGQARGFMVIDTETKTTEFVEIPNRTFKTVTGAEEAEDLDMTKHYIRFRVDEEEMAQMAPVIELAPAHRVELTREYSDERRMDLDFSHPFAEMVKRYAVELDRADAVDIGVDILNEALGESE